jgi:hypothetical protein
VGEDAAKTEEEIKVLAAMRDARVRAIALRAVGLPARCRTASPRSSPAPGSRWAFLRTRAIPPGNDVSPHEPAPAEGTGPEEALRIWDIPDKDGSNMSRGIRKARRRCQAVIAELRLPPEAGLEKTCEYVTRQTACRSIPSPCPWAE